MPVESPVHVRRCHTSIHVQRYVDILLAKSKLQLRRRRCYLATGMLSVSGALAKQVRFHVSIASRFTFAMLAALAVAGCLGREVSSLQSVDVAEDGACSVRGSEVSCERTGEYLLANGASKASVVSIVADRRAPFDSVKAVLDSVKSAGMRLNMQTRDSREEPNKTMEPTR